MKLILEPVLQVKYLKLVLLESVAWEVIDKEELSVLTDLLLSLGACH